ncbi:MAG: response regulator, partial [Spirochaetales bacterium]|nr:response regulator [Spirochaetales bacterium]MCF7939805.1 response regulator [Spirochaetales bacterium]
MKRKILLVEDEALIAIAEVKTIEKYSFDVVTAYSGEKAIEIVRQDPEISLILMDIDLGKGMDGTEAAQEILKTHDLPVAFLSSHTEPEVVEKTEGITSYGFIVKNSGETVLMASIRMAFRLFDAHMELKLQKEHLRNTLVRQEQTEEELVQKSEELESYFHSSLDLLCIAGIEGKFLRLNPEWRAKVNGNTVYAVARDITGRKEVEDNLRITLDSIGDAVISTDIQGNVVRMNPVA